jgi:hypothetical protein
MSVSAGRSRYLADVPVCELAPDMYCGRSAAARERTPATAAIGSHNAAHEVSGRLCEEDTAGRPTRQSQRVETPTLKGGPPAEVMLTYPEGFVEKPHPFSITSSRGAKRRGDLTDHQRLRLPRFGCGEPRYDVNGAFATLPIRWDDRPGRELRTPPHTGRCEDDKHKTINIPTK